MVDFHKAVRALYDNVYYVNDNKAYDINDNEINVDMNLIKAWKDPNEYKYQRQLAYKSIEEQLDMQYWDKVNGTNLWKEHIDSVKAQYPKGE